MAGYVNNLAFRREHDRLAWTRCLDSAIITDQDRGAGQRRPTGPIDQCTVGEGKHKLTARRA